MELPGENDDPEEEAALAAAGDGSGAVAAAPAPSAPAPVNLPIAAPGPGRTTVTQSLPTPGEVQAQGAAQAALGRQVDLIHQQADQQAQLTIAQQQAAARKQATEGQYNDQIAAINKQAVKEYGDAMGAYHAEQDKYRGMHATDYWEGKGPLAKIGAAFAAALGTYGAAMTHGPNYAMQILDGAVEEHARNEAAKIGKQKDIGGEARGRAGDVLAMRENQERAYSAAKVAALDKIGADAKAAEAKYAGTQAELKMRALAEQIEAKKADEQRKYEESTRARVVQTSKHRAAGVGGGGAGFNPKIEAANSKQVTEIDREARNFAKESGLDIARKAYVELDSAVKKLAATKDPATQIAVLDSFIRANRGGSATAQAMKQQLEHLGGIGARIQGAIERGNTGGLGDDEKANLLQAIQTAHGEVGGQIKDIHEDFVSTYYTGARYQQKGNWEEKENELFGRLGYKSRPDPNAPTIVPGSGQRSVSQRGVNARAGAAERAAAPSPGAPAAAPKLVGRDLAAVQMARARLAANPHDAIARQVLQIHGLAQ